MNLDVGMGVPDRNLHFPPAGWEYEIGYAPGYLSSGRQRPRYAPALPTDYPALAPAELERLKGLLAGLRGGAGWPDLDASAQRA